MEPRCSGIHRGMGTHISRVKSVDLDAWTDEQLQNILKWGNARANKSVKVLSREDSILTGIGTGNLSWRRVISRQKRMCNQVCGQDTFAEPSTVRLRTLFEQSMSRRGG